MPDRDTSSPHLALGGSPVGLVVRLMRTTALGWLFGLAAFSVLLGTVAESSAKDISGNSAMEQAMARLGGHGTLVAAYLGLTFLMLAPMIALVAVGQITAVRDEEAEGHLEDLAVRPMSRTSWFAQRVGLAAFLIRTAGLVVGVVPPALFLLGLGALTFGARPRRTAIVGYWPRAPTGDWGGNTMIVRLAIGAAVVGGILFNRRDVIGA